MPHLAILHTGLRPDEKLLLAAAESRKVLVTLIDLRQTKLDPQELNYWRQFDCLLERSISTVRGNAAIDFLSNLGLNVVNTAEVMQVCNDKFQTSVRLAHHSVPQARSVLVFDEAQAKAAVQNLGGYPVVIKSREGSWGRFVSKVNDEDSLEGVLELRAQLGPAHQAHIIQEFIPKPHKRDLRATVIDGQVVAAIYRTTEHWITNTARGAQASNCPINSDLQDICAQASAAVGGGILGIDLFEAESGYVINEINHTMEYKNVQAVTGVNLADKILEYCL
jgi:[lysine-biosynthesis-protein LysW]--L-2-aminoadipate ligase